MNTASSARMSGRTITKNAECSYGCCRDEGNGAKDRHSRVKLNRTRDKAALRRQTAALLSR